MSHKLITWNADLHACREIFHCQDTGLEFVLAQDHDAAGHLVGGLE